MRADIYILGISAFYHDSAACLLKNGKIISAVQEERFTRVKHDSNFPQYSINFCLEYAGITIKDITHVVFYEKPFLKFERLLLTYLSFAPVGIKSFLKAMPVWLKEKIFIKAIIKEKLLFDGEVLFSLHHQSHAASAFFPSPFPEAAIITMDGVGEWATTSWGIGKGNQIQLNSEVRFPHSLGLLYSAFTYYIGFRVNSGEYKLMGLAPYGVPKYVDLIRKEVVDIKEDGSFWLNMKYFNYCVGLTMTNEHFHRLFDVPPRQPESPITQKHKDIAASIQAVIEEIMIKIARHVHAKTGEDALCLAGGVALNCVANARILKETPFKRIWIQPAAGDAGGALGAALFVWYQHLNKPRTVDDVHDAQQGSLLGPQAGRDIKDLAEQYGWVYEYLPDNVLGGRIAQILENQHVVGVCQGRMEFGPRALGARSIIADPRSKQMQTILNQKIKFRESFRPFAPAVLLERSQEYFDLESKSPYMLLVAQVNRDKRSVISSVTHIDHSARVQTVDQAENPLLYRIIKAFERQTNCPMVINTSFNIRGEPMVCTDADAYRCFMCTGMDYLLVGNYLFERNKQPNKDKYKREDIATVLD